MGPLLFDCKNLLKAIPNKRLEHKYHETNQCTDALAKMGSSYSTSFVDFVEPLLVVESLLAFDKASCVVTDLLIPSLCNSPVY